MILPFSIRKKKIYIIIHAYIITKKKVLSRKYIEKTGKKAKKSGFLAGKAEKSAVKSSVTGKSGIVDELQELGHEINVNISDEIKIEKYEDDIRKHSNKVRNLQKKIMHFLCKFLCITERFV